MNTSDNDSSGDSEDDLFYFETDHLALKGNRDYNELIKTMVVLQEQRKQAINDYNTIVRMKKESLENPLEFIEKLKSGSLDLPKIQNSIELPKINWDKYQIKIPPSFEQCFKEGEEDNAKKIQKSHWTLEEQRKLEQLLIKYPQERVELNRYRKIAKELGTRTVYQVASRLQKYYLKLQKAGLPIPGRKPKANVQSKKKWKHYKTPFKPSTFFPDFHIPVVMDETQPVAGPSNAPDSSDNSSEVSSNYLITNNYYDSNQSIAPVQKADIKLIQLEILKKVKQEKMNSSSTYYHYGYKCNHCDETPLEGTRWHCITCDRDSIDFCTDCFLSQMYSDNPHNLHHNFELIRNDGDRETLFESDSESTKSINNDDSNSEMSTLDATIKEELIDYDDFFNFTTNHDSEDT